MKKLLLLASLSTIICCKNLPSEKSAEDAVKSTISEMSDQNVELINFKKVNAQEQNIFGIEIYNIEYEGKIKYKKGGYISDNYVNSLGLNASNFLMIKDNVNPNQESHYLKVVANDEKEITGKIEFEKKENGWSPKKPFIKIK